MSRRDLAAFLAQLDGIAAARRAADAELADLPAGPATEPPSAPQTTDTEDTVHAD